MYMTTPVAMPALSFTSATGAPISLETFKGRFLLLNIWATWCAPCRAEMPTLDRLQGTLGSPHFQVVPLSIDAGGFPAVQQFYKNIGIKRLGVYLNISGSAMDILKLEGIPVTFLINPDGQRIGRLTGAADWDSPSALAIFKQTIAFS